MRFLFGCLVSSIILMLCATAQSQDKSFAIQGKLILQAKQTIDVVALTLNSLPDTALIGQGSLDKTGSFRFANIKPGTYLLVITSAGYQSYSSGPIQIDSTSITLQPILMIPVPTSLKEVVVISKVNFIETRPDRTILNVEKSSVVGANALGILNTAPGVRVSSSGDILFKGGQKAAIAIDGRVINLGSQDIAAQLQNMQSAGIGQIELIPNPSAKYDAAGSGGLINIISKKGKGYGFHGSVNQGFDYGTFFKIRTDINFNYRSRKLNFFGQYGFGENNTNHTINTNRYVGDNINYNVAYYNKQVNYRNVYNAGIDYSIDNAHTLGVLVTGYFNNYFINKNTKTGISNFGRLDSSLNTSSTLHRWFDNIDYNLNYIGKLGNSSQTLSADADYSIYSRTNKEDGNSVLYKVLNATYSLPQYFINRAPTRITNLSGKVDYIAPFSKTSRLEAGLKSIYVQSSNTQQFNYLIGGSMVTDPSLSGQFNYTENINSAYLNYINNTGKKFNYQLGLRADRTVSDANTISGNYRIKRDYTNLFPFASFNLNFQPDQQLFLIYNRRIDRPGYQDLNPIIAYQDKYNVTANNAYLRPSYTDKIELKHLYKDVLTTSVYASFTKDAFNFPYFSQNDATGIYTTGKTNLKQANVYGTNINLAVDFAKWWNFNFDTDVSLQHFEDYAGYLNKDAFDALFKLTQQFKLPLNITINLYGQYEVPTFYTIYSYYESYFINASIRKQIMGKKAAIAFSADDIFNTNRDRYSSDYANLNLVGYNKAETRVFRLSFIYSFGKNTVTASRKHVTGNSDELNRLKTTN